MDHIGPEGAYKTRDLEGYPPLLTILPDPQIVKDDTCFVQGLGEVTPFVIEDSGIDKEAYFTMRRLSDAQVYSEDLRAPCCQGIDHVKHPHGLASSCRTEAVTRKR